MSVIKVRWSVPYLDNVMTLFDQVQVWRSTTTYDGVYTEITDAGTRVDLVAGVTDYLFDDDTGDSSYWYATRYYNSTTLAFSDLSNPVQGDLSGYTTIQDVRDEGYSETLVSDTAVANGIARARAFIERFTRRWFEPRVRTFKLDGNGKRRLRFENPLIALTSVSIDDTDIDVDSFKVYNRHLTQGLLNPDDRANSKLEWNLVEPTTGRHTGWFAEGLFTKGQQNVVIEGIWGYTELTPDDPVGETDDGSQVPLDYGEAPELVKLASLLLTIRYMFPYASDESEAIELQNRIIKRKTWDQEVQFADPTGANASGGAIGDETIQNLLDAYVAQPSWGAV